MGTPTFTPYQKHILFQTGLPRTETFSHPRNFKVPGSKPSFRWQQWRAGLLNHKLITCIVACGASRLLSVESSSSSSSYWGFSFRICALRVQFQGTEEDEALEESKGSQKWVGWRMWWWSCLALRGAWCSTRCRSQIMARGSKRGSLSLESSVSCTCWASPLRLERLCGLPSSAVSSCSSKCSTS